MTLTAKVNYLEKQVNRLEIENAALKSCIEERGERALLQRVLREFAKLVDSKELVRVLCEDKEQKS